MGHARETVDDALQSILSIDATLSEAIDREINRQRIIQGWAVGTTTDAQEIYVGLLALRALLARLITDALNQIEEMVEGPETVKFVKRAELLKLLRNQVEDQLQEAAKIADPQDVKADEKLPTPPPLIGLRKVLE